MSGLLQHVHHFSEPQTADRDPINGLLDLFDAQVRLLLEHGAEAQLRARFARLLPEPELTINFQSELELQPTAGVFAVAGELGLTALLTDLRRVKKLKMTALSHAAVTAVEAHCERDLAALKADRVPA